VTRDRARKKAIRARMAVSGEPYSVAARKLAATGPAGGATAVREIIVRADKTHRNRRERRRLAGGAHAPVR